MQLIDTIETYTFGTSKDLVSKKKKKRLNITRNGPHYSNCV